MSNDTSGALIKHSHYLMIKNKNYNIKKKKMNVTMSWLMSYVRIDSGCVEF